MSDSCNHKFPADFTGVVKACRICGLSWFEFILKQRESK